MGKFLIFMGISLTVLGILIVFAQKSGATGWFGWFGHLPLDIRIEKENFGFYFPIGSSILLSVILSLILAIINKFIR
ncbi:MAG: DUF2905 domain-containing protein [Chlorobiaceae bacterium]|jgi:hypothetical protein|nr:DUF2905 domain-containing protein [Chlorobiaceae bacterium]NTW73511.1 DUF2905 domain-containing protein [Chlorobiaceae bacterium]